MSKLLDAMCYVCANYSCKDDLSKSRLIKIIYLADWKFAINYKCQITDAHWMFDQNGPSVYCIEELFEKNTSFEIIHIKNNFNDTKDIVKLKNVEIYNKLTNDEIAVLDSIINMTARMNWEQFVRVVYSTYPILTQPKMSKLNLIYLSKKYKTIKSTLFKVTPEIME